ncbi:MAG: Flp family type IVb pilin [Actinobacteria bacterium]|nr:Flp family type IVb pilin [Actinomycetota bacterium]
MLVFLQAYLQSRASDERGSVAAEYGLLIFLIALAIIAAVTALGGQLDVIFDRVTTGLGGTASP